LSTISESTLTLSDPDVVLQLFGPQDQNLRAMRSQLGVSITHRGGQVKISGEPEAVRRATELLERMRDRLGRGGIVAQAEVAKELGTLTGSAAESGVPQRVERTAELAVKHATRRIRPKTDGQAGYVEAIRQHEMTFCVGPAGSGKTYLAVAAAVEAFKAKKVRKIVLVRPAVEAGESLGFLPGDLQAKLNPYLRPLLDSLQDMVDYDQVKFLMEQDVIEVIPLAYMRGRTLNDAFIILDEAQNTTVAQMKMFLTRMGQQSKVVVSGDVTQTDLPHGVTSGLRDALQRLQGIPGIAFVRLGEQDIVRHQLVQRIVTAYDAASGGRPGA
jgi:phosphate starvation-inducible protein PhoH and related proteins